MFPDRGAALRAKKIGAICADLSGHLCGLGYPKPQLVQLLLNSHVNRFLRVDFGWFVTLHLQHGSDNFPAGIPAMDLESVLNEFSTCGTGAGHWHENPFIVLQTMKGFELSMGNADRVKVVIHCIHPWLFTHRAACVVEKDPKLISTDDGPHAA